MPGWVREDAILKLILVEWVGPVEMGSGHKSWRTHLTLSYILYSMGKIVVVARLVRTVSVIIEDILSKLVLPASDPMLSFSTSFGEIKWSTHISCKYLKLFPRTGNLNEFLRLIFLIFDIA